MKKTAITLACGIAVLALAGCNKKQSETSDNGAPVKLEQVKSVELPRKPEWHGW